MPRTMELTLMSVSTCDNEGVEMKGNSGLLWRGLTSVTGTLLVLGICGTQCSYMYAGTINSALGTSSTRIVAGEGGGNTTYYASEYGDLNAENL